MHKAEKINIFLLLIVACLSGISLVFVYSSTPLSSYFFYKHIFHFCLGVILMLTMMLIGYRWLIKYVNLFFIFCIVLLLLPLIQKFYSDSPARWIKIFGYSFQPSELAKIATIAYLAKRLSEKIPQNFKEFTVLLLPPSIIFLLIILQPHFGVIFLLFLTTLVLLFVSRIRLRFLGTFLLIGVVCGLIFYQKCDYLKARAVGYKNPWQSMQEEGYHLIQAQIAIGSGGFLGKGIGQGESKLNYLPLAHTDSIFALIGEEGGFVLCCLVVFLYICFLFCSLRIAKSSICEFGHYLAIGIGFILTFQALLNISMYVGLIPISGLPLPFVSYGGTFTVTNFINVGILLSIFQTKKKLQREVLKIR